MSLAVPLALPFDDVKPQETAGAFPPPRPFQVTAHEKLREGLRHGHRRQLLAAPTGSGKSYLGLQVIHEALKKGRRGLFVCDRTALINQTSAVADSYGLTEHGIVQANHWRRDNALPFQIASIQTIQARGYWPPADVIVIDETHILYGAIREKLSSSNAAIVGLTATPCTKGLGRLYTNLINAVTMHELTESGVLVPLKILTCVTPDMRGAETASGEWTAHAASERELTIIGDVVREWQEHGENRKTIGFGADIAYCTELAQRFNVAGIPTQLYTSETKSAEREEILEEFRKPESEIRILLSVEALGRGFDVPDIECVIDARPLRKSLSTVVQMWGRGVRSSPDTAKTSCILLDFSGNARRFIRDFEDIYFNGFTALDTAEKMDRVIRKDEDYVPTGCPQCGHKPFHKRCLACGYEKVTRANVVEEAGEMREIRIGKRVAATDKEHLWRQVCTVAATAKKPQGRAAHLFRDITGEWPPENWHISQTEPAEPTSATLGKIRSLNIAWRKGRHRAAA